MKKPILSLLGCLMQISGFPQSGYETIRISKDLELIRISDHAYVHVSYATLPNFGRFSSNGLVFVNDGEAFLCDTPVTDSLTMDLVSWIRDTMKLQIAGFVPNHWHPDCMGGLGYLLKQHIATYANQMTIDMARLKGLPVPEHGFHDSLTLNAGDIPVCCYYLGAAHTTDNIVVWIPSEKILFAGCMVKSMDSKNLGNIVDGDPVAYPKTIDRLIDKFPNAKIVIPGHGVFGGFELIMNTRDLASKYRQKQQKVPD